MNLTYPIKLDSPVYHGERTIDEIAEGDLDVKHSFVDAQGNLVQVSGYDSSEANDGKGIRVTNLVGTNEGFLLKCCPRCGNNKPHPEFNLETGRVTNEGRDQSQCTACRNLPPTSR